MLKQDNKRQSSQYQNQEIPSRSTNNQGNLQASVSQFDQNLEEYTEQLINKNEFNQQEDMALQNSLDDSLLFYYKQIIEKQKQLHSFLYEQNDQFYKNSSQQDKEYIQNLVNEIKMIFSMFKKLILDLNLQMIQNSNFDVSLSLPNQDLQNLTKEKQQTMPSKKDQISVGKTNPELQIQIQTLKLDLEKYQNQCTVYKTLYDELQQEMSNIKNINKRMANTKSNDSQIQQLTLENKLLKWQLEESNFHLQKSKQMDIILQNKELENTYMQKQMWKYKVLYDNATQKLQELEKCKYMHQCASVKYRECESREFDNEKDTLVNNASSNQKQDNQNEGCQENYLQELTELRQSISEKTQFIEKLLDNINELKSINQIITQKASQIEQELDQQYQSQIKQNEEYYQRQLVVKDQRINELINELRTIKLSKFPIDNSIVDNELFFSMGQMESQRSKNEYLKQNSLDKIRYQQQILQLSQQQGSASDRTMHKHQLMQNIKNLESIIIEKEEEIKQLQFQKSNYLKNSQKLFQKIDNISELFASKKDLKVSQQGNEQNNLQAKEQTINKNQSEIPKKGSVEQLPNIQNNQGQKLNNPAIYEQNEVENNNDLRINEGRLLELKIQELENQIEDLIKQKDNAFYQLQKIQQNEDEEKQDKSNNFLQQFEDVSSFIHHGSEEFLQNLQNQQKQLYDQINQKKNIKQTQND